VISYAEYRPAPELAPWVARLWRFVVVGSAREHRDHQVTPDGGVSLAWSRREGPLLIGPHLAPFHPSLRRGDHLWGLRFWPGAAAPVLRVEPATLRDCIVPAEEGVPGRIVEALAEGMDHVTRPQHEPEPPASREAEALAMLAGVAGAAIAAPDALAPDGLIMHAVFRQLRADGREPIQGIAERLGLSTRQLRRRHRAAVGLAPSELARIRRERASTARGLVEPAAAWIDVAAERGWSDHGLLVREYERLLDLPPDHLAKRLRRIEDRLVASWTA
jgi:AraC-like DNA-binding protein